MKKANLPKGKDAKLKGLRRQWHGSQLPQTSLGTYVPGRNLLFQKFNEGVGYFFKE